MPQNVLLTLLLKDKNSNPKLIVEKKRTQMLTMKLEKDILCLTGHIVTFIKSGHVSYYQVTETKSTSVPNKFHQSEQE